MQALEWLTKSFYMILQKCSDRKVTVSGRLEWHNDGWNETLGEEDMKMEG